jgi:hypothetical protein
MNRIVVLRTVAKKYALSVKMMPIAVVMHIFCLGPSIVARRFLLRG